MYHYTFKDLKEAVKKWEEMGVSDDAPIFMERVEDVYFDQHGWKTEEYQFPMMCGPQNFFEIHWMGPHDGKILVHAHY